MTAQEFISEAVREGMTIAPMVYLETLEQSLRNDVILSEAGNAQNYLQMMINEAEASAEE